MPVCRFAAFATNTAFLASGSGARLTGQVFMTGRELPAEVATNRIGTKVKDSPQLSLHHQWI